MTPREQRRIRKIWRERTKRHRDRLKKVTRNVPDTPPPSDNEEQAAPQMVHNNRAHAAKMRSFNQRKLRNKTIKKQKEKIKRLSEKLKTYKRKLKRITKKETIIDEMTPNSKITALISDTRGNVEEVKRKLLFSEIMENQLKENVKLIKNDKEEKIFRRVLSGPIVNKYKTVLKEMNINPIKTTGKMNRSLLDFERKARKDKKSNKITASITRFLEEDCNSRLCPGKKDFITKNKVKKQKRILLDTMKHLYSKYLKSSKIKMSYTMFCRMRPFWIIPPRITHRETCLCVTHANMDLILSCLNQAKILLFSKHQSLVEYLCCDRYRELCISRECEKCKTRQIPYQKFDNSISIKYNNWQSIIEEIEDIKTKKIRKVRKYTKKTIISTPRDIILKLENNLEGFLKHEFNIYHQYQIVKSLKDNLNENDCLIHMDFSENYNTKYSEEIQSFHFGGSRTQISLHTVVVYTKNKTECFATMSNILHHNVPAIWAHLQPIMQLLPISIENINFLSDGPVTQYRNKYMFFYLACQLTTFYPNISNYTWNYHEAGHGKGAPDGIGGTCKRTADRLVANGTDIPNIETFAKAIEENCPGIKTFVISDADIQLQQRIFDSHQLHIKPFSGTLKVHQVRGSAFLPFKLKLKSLSCFCSTDSCPHYHLGQIVYPQNVKNKLNVAEIYSESDAEFDEVPSFSKNSVDYGNQTYRNGDYVLVKFIQKKNEYRYVGVCSSELDEDNGEILVTFLKCCNDSATLFKVDEKDTSYIPLEQMCRQLPQPELVVQGDRIFLKFQTPVDIFER